MITRPEALGRWKGVLIPVVTPFTETGELNLSALHENICWLIDRGAGLGNSILLVAGSGGDFTSMNVAERIEVISTVTRASGGTLPVIAGAQSLDIRESVEICQACEELGVDGVQISGPYYYDGRPGDVIAWLETIASQTSIAFALYNNWYTGYNMPLTLVERLLEIPNVSGLKWSAPDMSTFFEGVRRFARTLAVINNTLNTVPGYLAGCTAFVSHIPNFWPEFGWRIWDLMESDRYEEAQAEFDRVMEPYEALVGPIQRETAGEAVFVRPAMAAVGLEAGVSRPPSRDTVIGAELRETFSRFVNTFVTKTPASSADKAHLAPTTR